MNHAHRLQNIFNDLMAHDNRPPEKKGVGRRPGRPSRLQIKKVVVEGAGSAVADQTQTNPTDGGPLVNLGYPIWEVGGPQITDINQGYLADCYFLAVLASLANTANGRNYLQSILVPDPNVPNGVITSYQRNGTVTRIHSDVLVITGANQSWNDGYNNDLWPEIFEKTYALFRSGADTYASLNYGSSMIVCYDIGCTPSSSFDYNNKYNLIRSGLANQTPMFAYTPSFGDPLPNLIPNHVYSIVGIDDANNVKLYNPWGIYAPDQWRIVSPADFNTSNFYSIQYGTTPIVSGPSVADLQAQIAALQLKIANTKKALS